MFYTFSQNNSGGFFKRDDSVREYVIIEADSAEQANERAEAVGIYFNGCATGSDCTCCGDRWSEQWDDEDGTEMPSIYGTSVYETKRGMFQEGCIIYRIDGTKETVEFPNAYDN